MTESERDTLAAECVDMVMDEPGVILPWNTIARLTKFFRSTLDLAYAAGKVDGGDQMAAVTMKAFEDYAAGASPAEPSTGGQVLP